MVVLLVTGIVPAAVATLIAAIALVLVRTITIDQAYDGINWKTIVLVAAAASLLTPIATPANLMVQPAGGYRFGDYWKLGLPLLIWFGVVAVLLVPLIWPL